MSTTRSANNTGPQRYLISNDPAAAFTLGVGVMAAMPLDTAARRVYPIGKSLIASLLFFGGHSDGVSSGNNLTFNYRVFGIHRPVKFYGSIGDQGIRTFLGSGTVILGLQTGAAGQAVGATEHFADTVSWTPSDVATTPAGPLKIAETAFNEGASAAYQATVPDDKHTFVFVPNIIRATGLQIDFACTAPCAANCLIMVDEV